MSLKKIENLNEWTSLGVEVALTIGNFDGIHRGHQALLAATKAAAERFGGKTMVLTLDPHPTQVLFPERPFARLFDLADQDEQLAFHGIDYLFRQRFDSAFRELTATQFLQKFLQEGIRPRALIVGHDFRFGQGRTGNEDLLRGWAAGLGVDFHVVRSQMVQDEVVSSSAIRQALTDGRISTATHMLGRYYELRGQVISGQKRGRTIGFPTANLHPTVPFAPRLGVYATTCFTQGQWWKSVTNIGVNPTVTSTQNLKIESHLFDFNADIYDQKLIIRLHQFLRPEQKFADFQSLQTQIQIDAENAKGILQ